MFVYKVGKLSYDEVLRFLNDVDESFSPPLSTKVPIEAFANKLSRYSEFSYCYDENHILGMISCYLNRPPEAFISIACVRKGYQNNGIFRKLFDKLVNKIKIMSFKTIRLEVLDSNHIAQIVYKNVGFKEVGIASEDSHYYVMVVEA